MLDNSVGRESLSPVCVEKKLNYPTPLNHSNLLTWEASPFRPFSLRPLRVISFDVGRSFPHPLVYHAHRSAVARPRTNWLIKESSGFQCGMAARTRAMQIQFTPKERWSQVKYQAVQGVKFSKTNRYRIFFYINL